MCGFVALIGKHGAQAERHVVKHATDLIEHRGPDEEGFYFEADIGFGFRRLSILDLSTAGHQPMFSDDGNFVIIFNGEIFNYIELREELTRKGYAFRSTGDTEVLLNAFREWGNDCVNRLNGMWAFLIHDRQRNTLFGARDRFGIKPLYFHDDSKWLMLASEIKAIRDSGIYRKDQNWKTVARYFVNGELDGTEDTFYRDIYQIMPGTAFEIDQNRVLHRWSFWSIPEENQAPDSNPVEAFERLFVDTVKLRMRSDVPVGVTLSGGLDSTSIICCMSDLKSALPGGSAEPTMAFSFNDRDFDESRFLRDTVEQTRVDLKNLSTDPMHVWEALPEVLWHHDEPVHSMTALVGYQLMKLARSCGVKVVLTGQGADETLAGYPSYFSNYRQSLINNGRWGYLWNDLRAFTTAHSGQPGRLLRSEIERNIKNRLSHLSCYRQQVLRKRKQQILQNDWFSPDLIREIKLQDHGPLDISLAGALATSVTEQPLPLYLRIEDRNSMAASVEARLPFLDYRLVSLAFSLPATWKIKGPWNKFILRQAMKNRIPKSVSQRIDKFGFPTPVDRWLRTTLHEPVRSVLDSSSTRERGIYNHKRIIADCEQHRLGNIEAGARLFDIAQYELWVNQCM